MERTEPDTPIAVLLVEDDADSGHAVRNMLRSRGMAVEWVTCAEQARNRLRNERPDVVVSDIRLGEMSGVDLLRHVRENYGELPMILTTGFDTLATAIDAVRLGAQDYILKPFDTIDDLARPVQQAVAAHRMLLRNRRLEADLRRSEARFRSVLDSSEDVIFRFDLLADRLDYVNSSVGAVLGFPPDTFQNARIEDVLGYVHPEDREVTREYLAQVARLTPEHEPLKPWECRVRRSDDGYCIGSSINERQIFASQDVLC